MEPKRSGRVSGAPHTAGKGRDVKNTVPDHHSTKSLPGDTGWRRKGGASLRTCGRKDAAVTEEAGSDMHREF